MGGTLLSINTAVHDVVYVVKTGQRCRNVSLITQRPRSKEKINQSLTTGGRPPEITEGLLEKGQRLINPSQKKDVPKERPQTLFDAENDVVYVRWMIELWNAVKLKKVKRFLGKNNNKIN